jgi:alpha-glucosidase
LVAPVTREAARSWPVYLPRGGWYDFWTGERYEGPAGVAVDAPLDRLPLLVRAGAIIPLGPVMQHTGERPLDEITLLVYPEGVSRFELYEDDGRSNEYRRGQYAQTAFECVGGPDEVIVRIGEAVGDRSVVPAGRSYVLKVRAERPASVLVEGVGELPALPDSSGDAAGWWTEEPGFVIVRLPRRQSAVVTLRRG